VASNLTPSDNTTSDTGSMSPTPLPAHTNQQQNFVIEGDWNLKIVQGNIKNFAAVLGGGRLGDPQFHSYAFIGPVKENAAVQSSPIFLSSNNSAEFTVLTDILIDNKVSWHGVPTTVVITLSGNIISILADQSKTYNELFAGSPLVGYVSSLLDEKNNELRIFASDQSVLAIENNPLGIVLSGRAPNPNTDLSATIVSNPTHGTLSQ